MRPFIIVFCITCNMGFSQVLNGEYIKKDISRIDMVVTKTRYKFIPKENQMVIPQMTFFERFDSLQRIIEEKDINSDGSMYAWRFIEYDKNDNIIHEKVFNRDSVLLHDIYYSYDDKKRILESKGIEPNGQRFFNGIYSYNKSHVTYIGWHSDSTTKSVYHYELDSLGREIYFSNLTDNYDVNAIYQEEFTQYLDTFKLKKTEKNYKNGRLYEIEEKEFNAFGKVTKETRIDTLGNLHLKEVNKYDSLGGTIYHVLYQNDKVSYVHHSLNEYDKYGRIIRTKEYTDTLAFKPYLFIDTIITTYHYPKYNPKNKSKVINIHYPDSNFGAPLEKTTSILYDDDNNWISTTESFDGELKEYYFTVYEFKTLKKKDYLRNKNPINKK